MLEDSPPWQLVGYAVVGFLLMLSWDDDFSGVHRYSVLAVGLVLIAFFAWKGNIWGIATVTIADGVYMAVARRWFVKKGRST